MTPKEIGYMMEGYMWRKDEQAELQAHFTAQIVNPHVKRRVKGRDLYKRRTLDKGEVIPLEERKKRFEKAVSIMGPQAIPVKRPVK